MKGMQRRILLKRRVWITSTAAVLGSSKACLLDDSSSTEIKYNSNERSNGQEYYSPANAADIDLND